MRVEGKVYAIDLGATNLRIGIVDQDLKIIDVLREKSTKDDPLALYDQIHRMITTLYEKNKVEVEYIGVSCCGFVEDNKIKLLPNLHIQRFDLMYHLQQDFKNCKVFIANDANAAAYAEASYGSTSEVENSFFYTISSGIGGCLVYGRKLVNLPFEIGHQFFQYKNQFHEIEELLSGNGIVKLCQLNKVKVKDASEMFEGVKKGNKKFKEIYNDWIKNLGAFIANIQLNFNTDLVVLSGGVMKSKDVFLDDLSAVANAFIARYPVKRIRFVNAKFDQDVGLIGGASVGLSLLPEKEA